MLTIQQAVMMAQSTPSGTPEYDLACDICRLRGVDPHLFNPQSWFPQPHWQLVIAEQLLEQALRDTMMQPAGER